VCPKDGLFNSTVLIQAAHSPLISCTCTQAEAQLGTRERRLSEALREVVAQHADLAQARKELVGARARTEEGAAGTEHLRAEVALLRSELELARRKVGGLGVAQYA
jgi:multidrug resistance efflux pump